MTRLRTGLVGSERPSVRIVRAVGSIGGACGRDAAQLLDAHRVRTSRREVRLIRGELAGALSPRRT